MLTDTAALALAWGAAQSPSGRRATPRSEAIIARR